MKIRIVASKEEVMTLVEKALVIELNFELKFNPSNLSEVALILEHEDEHRVVAFISVIRTIKFWFMQQHY